MRRTTELFLDDYRNGRIAEKDVPGVLYDYGDHVIAEIASAIKAPGTTRAERMTSIPKRLPQWRSVTIAEALRKRYQEEHIGHRELLEILNDQSAEVLDALQDLLADPDFEPREPKVEAIAARLSNWKAAAVLPEDKTIFIGRSDSGGDSSGDGAGERTTTSPEHPGPQLREPFRVALAAKEPRDTITGDLLSNVIRARSRAISFENYRDAINRVVCKECNRDRGVPDRDDVIEAAPSARQRGRKEECRHNCREFAGERVFDKIKKGTFHFLRCECDLPTLIEGAGDGAFPPGANAAADVAADVAKDIYTTADDGTEGGLRYWDAIARQLLGRGLPESYFSADNCDGVIEAVSRGDCAIELIWSYWYEEAMLVQTMQTIAFRFQNRRRGERDPLASLEIDPLRPLNNIIWGYIQDERDQLSVARRAHEYDHHYGLRLKGRAVGHFNPIDSRDRFLGAFHHLLYLATIFYKEENDKTYEADGFPILTALQELHVILAEGAHNQFGDLPTQARAEMLIMQWILSRPEMREFLSGRASVPYRESWMGRVEAMRSLQGWSGASINHFSILAEFGERLLLSVRLRNWMDITDPVAGANWATFWRTEIQQYVNSYRAVTGVDLAAEATTADQLKLRRTLPSELLERTM